MLETINNSISQIIIFITEKAVSFWENITLLDLSGWQIFVDIFLVAIIFYYILRLIRGSRATHILTGLVIIAVIYLISQLLELFALKWLLDRFLTFLIIAIPIIFQQELRRGLEKLGQQSHFFKAKKQQELDWLISEVVTATSVIKKMKKGALIVIKRKDSLKDYEDTGVKIGAKVSKELLVSIFNPKSPLHDGAVIIENDKITSAACVLPHSFKKYSGTYGTRHKAALGLSDIADAIVIVVSEEKQTISFVRNEKIDLINEEHLAKNLKKYLSQVSK